MVIIEDFRVSRREGNCFGERFVTVEGVGEGGRSELFGVAENTRNGPEPAAAGEGTVDGLVDRFLCGREAGCWGCGGYLLS